MRFPGVQRGVSDQANAGAASPLPHERVSPFLFWLRRRPSPHKCNVPGCGKVFKYRSGLLAHIKSAHDQKHALRCPVSGCQQQFMNNAQLREHYERQHPNLPNSLYESRMPSSLPYMQMAALSIEGMGRGMIPAMPTQTTNVPTLSVRGSGEMRSDNVISEIPMMNDVMDK